MATETGIARAITSHFRHVVRNRSCARIMVVISNIELERMLLHSLATSTVSPGMSIRMPR